MTILTDILTPSGLAPLASPLLTGIPTAPTATAGTDTTQVATMAAILAAKGPDYDSGEIAIPADGASITALPHGLGAAPSFVKALLICKVADQGYTIGTIVDPSLMTNDNNTATYGLGLRWDTTNINAVMASSGFSIVNTSTGNGELLLATSWRLIFRAWL